MGCAQLRGDTQKSGKPEVAIVGGGSAAILLLSHLKDVCKPTAFEMKDRFSLEWSYVPNLRHHNHPESEPSSSVFDEEHFFALPKEGNSEKKARDTALFPPISRKLSTHSPPKLQRLTRCPASPPE